MPSLSRRASVAGAVSTLLVCSLVSTAGASPGGERPDSTGRPTDGVLVRQSFDSLADRLQPRAEDPGIEPGTVGFTHEPPEGWSVETPGAMAGGGIEEWRGWSFTTREFWNDAEDQMRYRFGRAHDVIAVADSDEFADGGDVPETFASTLSSEPVDVRGRREVLLTFDSHYRGWEGQSATVTVSFDGGEETELVRYDSSTVTDDYDGAAMNANEEVVVDVPAGARDATFRWHFESGANSWYWAIDSVAVREAEGAPQGTPTSAWVVSDIQGDPDDLGHALEDLAAVRPAASGLLMVGDIVDTGSAAQWQEIDDVMSGAEGLLPEQVAAAIGNHESYTGEPWTVLRDRFLDFAGRDEVWGEYLLTGEGGVDVPVLVLGQEEARPPEVPMSEAQLDWLDRRLDHWSRQRTQVLVISHFPLGDTASASWIPWYHDHYEFNDRITRMLGEHPNAVILNGHTHYPLELGDWAVQRRTDGGHPDGFWAVNTGAVQVEWDARGESTDGISEVVTRDINRGLTVDVYRDRMVVTGRDFGPVDGATPTNDVNDVVREVTIPNPYVHSAQRRG
ncbi:metallophosphoesterase family protein [Georgenia alba]|uniref:Metallophosphoesterase family protein n=1 Tax=Georgenia alba TaxID=2233858 RepID=A0ABW2Q6A6_9MICO